VTREEMRTATALFARAAELLPEHDPLRIRLLTRQGEALNWIAEWAAATTVLQEAIEGARAVGDPRLEWDARIEHSFAWRMTAHQTWLRHARSEAEQAIKVCDALGHDEGLAKAWRLLGFLHGDRGHHRRADEALERALAFARRSQDKRMERLMLGTLAQIAVSGPTSVDDAIHLVEGHRDEARTRRYPQWEAECDERLAVLWAMRGGFVEARDMLARARALREDLGVGGGFVSSAVVEKLAGDLAAAERAYRSALSFLEEHGNVGAQATVAAELAYVLQMQSRDEEALQLTEQSDEEAATEDVEAQVLWRRARARVLCHRGAVDEAQRLAREAVELVRPTDDVVLHADALVDLAAVLRLAGCADDALGALEQALPLYDQKGSLVMAEHARDLLGEIRTSVSIAP